MTTTYVPHQLVSPQPGTLNTLVPPQLIAPQATTNTLDPYQLVTTASTITPKLSAFWPLDNQASWGAEMVSGLNLSHGGINSSVGVRGDVAAGFNGTTSQAVVADNALLDIVNGHCFFGWVYIIGGGPTYPTILSKWDSNFPSNLGYDLHIHDGPPHLFFVERTAASNFLTVGPPTPPSSNQWHFIVCWRDPADNFIRMQLNNGTIYSSALQSAAGFNGESLYFGRGKAGPPPTNLPNYFSGRMQRWGWMNNDFLTPTERTYLYNGGQGKTWAEILSNT